MKKTLVIAFLLLTGCTSDGRGPIEINTTGKFFGSDQRAANVLSYAMTKEVRQFVSSTQEEQRAQQILTDNQNYEYTTWNNSTYGELRMAPTSTFTRKGQKCRGYRVDYWFTGSIRAQRPIPAIACQDGGGHWQASSY